MVINGKIENQATNLHYGCNTNQIHHLAENIMMGLKPKKCKYILLEVKRKKRICT